jgi:quinoprotein glucose dehydrogenase
MAETKSQQSRLLVTLTALFAAFCGLYLLIGGAWLVVLGGSWYYPIAGLVMLGVTVMLFRGKRCAVAVRRAAAGDHDLGRLGSRLRLLGADAA